MKCRDCKHYRHHSGNIFWCAWHGARLARDVVELDSAEKDCRGFEKR